MGRIEKRIKTFALERGADVVGIAPVERFEGAPKGFHPCDLLPGARSVIVIGKCYPLAVLEGKSMTAMTKVSATIFDTLDRCAHELSLLVEGLGGLALPIPADSPYLYWEPSRRHGKGDLSHRHAAVLAGLGSLGKNGLLLHPKLGNRLNLDSIITTLPLKGDPLVEKELCINNCSRCVDACPTKAIQKGKKVIQNRCRKVHTFKTARGFELWACWECRRVCPIQRRLLRPHLARPSFVI